MKKLSFFCQSTSISFLRSVFEKINNAFPSRRLKTFETGLKITAALSLFAFIYLSLNFQASTIAAMTSPTIRSRRLSYDIKRGRERVRKCGLKPFSLDRKRDRTRVRRSVSVFQRFNGTRKREDRPHARRFLCDAMQFALQNASPRLST